MKRQITKAIIAAAGYGTRFLPATKVQPKEMLPMIDKPIIQYLVEEAVASGIKEVIIVTRAGQHIMEDHFDSSFELETKLENSHKKELLEQIKQIPRMANFIYLRQTKDYPYGNGSPLLVAQNLINRGESFVYMFGDDLVQAKVPCTKQLINFWRQKGDGSQAVVAAQEVALNEVSRYGIWKLKRGSDYIVKDAVEKPDPDKTPSRLAQFGRFILNRQIIKILKKTPLGKGNELWLIDALRQYAHTGKVLLTRIDGQWMTTGDPLNYMKAMVEFALEREDIGQEFRSYLQKKIVEKAG